MKQLEEHWLFLDVFTAGVLIQLPQCCLRGATLILPPDHIGFFMCFTALPLPSAVQTVYVNNALSDSAKMSQIGKSGVHAMGSCYAG